METGKSNYNYNYRVIVFAGPPKAGKSTLIRRIYSSWQFRSKVFLVEANPDGEGFWTGQAQQNGIVSSQQKAKKELFSRFMEMAHQWVRWVHNLARLGFTVLVSLGGKVSSENAFILSSLSPLQPIILVLAPFNGEVERLERWARFAAEFGDTIVMVASHYPLRVLQP